MSIKERIFFTPEERCYVFSAIKKGHTRDQINDVLKKSQSKTGSPQRLVRESTYQMIKNGYLTRLTEAQQWDHFHKPKSLGSY